MLLRQGVKAALPNTQKQTQGGCQNEKTKKYGPNERKKTPEKELNEMGTRNLSDAEFKTLVIRMLSELTEYNNSIKKTRAEMKVTLSEIKIYSEPSMEGMAPRFKSMIWNIRKK